MSKTINQYCKFVTWIRQRAKALAAEEYEIINAKEKA